MIDLIESKMAEIESLCRAFHVSRLELFGSATDNRFDEVNSDVDFLVEFSEAGVKNYADCFFGLQEALEKLLSRSVDLVVISSLKNPYFIESVEKNKRVLYAA